MALGRVEDNQLQKCIYLVGPHSSGKTTLAKALWKHYGASVPLLQETAREVLKTKGYTKEDIESKRCFQMQRDILHAQFKAEENEITKHGPHVNFISDRAAIDPILYAMKYSPVQDDWKRLIELNEWQVLAERYRDRSRSLVIVVEPCKAFLKDDGTRKMPSSWAEWVSFSNMFTEFLESQNISFHTIGESCMDLDERVRRVLFWTSAQSVV